MVTSIRTSSKKNARRFNGGGPRPDRLEFKRTEAKERQEAWAKLSPKEQLAALDRRLGKDIGATKQRARITNPKRPTRTVAEVKEAMQQLAPDTSVLAAPVDAGRVKAKDRRAEEQAKRPSR